MDGVEIERRLRRFFEERAEAEGVAAAWLYGSVARGTARPDSDVDVGIHKPGQWGNKPATPPVGSDTLPLPGSGSRHTPEPASLALLSIGAFGLAAGRLRQRKTRSETTS